MLHRFAEGDAEVISYMPAVVTARTNTTHFSAQLHCTASEGTLQNFPLVTTIPLNCAPKRQVDKTLSITSIFKGLFFLKTPRACKDKLQLP